MGATMYDQHTTTAVTLNTAELKALVELFRVAQSRLSTAEQLYFNSLFGRFDEELRAQEADQLNQMRLYEEAMQQPQPGGDASMVDT